MKKLTLALAIMAGLAAASAPAEAHGWGHGWRGGSAPRWGGGWGPSPAAGRAPYRYGRDGYGSYHACSGWSYGIYIGRPCSDAAHFWDSYWW